MNRFLILTIEVMTPRVDREWVVGDTIEELSTIEQSAGPAAARRWLRSEAWRVMLSAPRHRMAALGRGTNSATAQAGAVRTAPLHRSLRLAPIGSEFHNALRGLRAGRATTALAFTILTLTMAAGTITFSVVDGLALRPLPYGDPATLMSLASPSPGAGRFRAAIPQDYFAWLEATQSFESLGAASFVASRELEVDGTFETLVTKGITSNLFDVLGVPPAAGRFFGPQHEQPGGPADVILSHDVWLRKFRLDPTVIGRRLTVGQEVREVIGVLPKGVSFPITTGPPTDLYIPYIPAARDRAVDGPRRSILSSIVGRLRPGVTLEQASADANRISAAEVVPLHVQVVGPEKTWLFLMLAAVGFVLLVGCVNVASLLLMRATTRARTNWPRGKRLAPHVAAWPVLCSSKD